MKQWRFYIISMIAGLFCVQPTYADGKFLSMRDAIFLALRFNANVQTSELQRVVDKFSLEVAENQFDWQYGLQGSAAYTSSRAGGLSSTASSTGLTPTASRNFEYGTTFGLTMNNPTSNGIYNPGITMTATQPLMRGFGKAITLTPLYDAEDSEMISRLGFKDTIIQTVSQVISTYNRLVQSINQMKISAQTLSAYKDTMDDIRANIRAGRRAATDILQAEANYASERVRMQQAKNTVVNTQRDLVSLIGLKIDTKIMVDTSPVYEIKPLPSSEAAFEQALDTNIPYLTSLISIKSVRRSLLVAKDNMRPQLDLSIDASTGGGSGGSFNSGISSLVNNKNTSVGARLTLDIPIQNYSLKQSLISSRVQLANAEINLTQQVRALYTTIYNNMEDVDSNAKQIGLSTEAITLREKDQEFLNAKLSHGLTTVFEVTTKQQELAQARDQLLNDQINYFNSLTVLYGNLGILLDVWEISVIY